MKVFAKVMVGPNLLNSPVTHDLGVLIEHNGMTFTIATDNHDRLILRSVDQTQLVVLPKGSNSAEIKAED